MADIHDQFEQEHDLHASFENEKDQAAPTTPAEEGPGYTEAALRGAVQGATAGYSDEILGGLQTAASPMEIIKADDSLAKMKQLYQQYRDMERAKNKAAEDAHSITYLGGNIAGGIAGLGKLGAGVKGAALLGAATGLGTSNADLTEGEFGRAAADTTIGGTIGAVAGKIGEKVGKMLSPDALKAGASSTVGKAIGAKGLPSQVQKIGGAAVDAGVLNHGITEESLGAIQAAKKEAQEAIAPVLKRVSDGLSTKTPEEINAALGGDAGDKVLGLIDQALDSMKYMSSDVTNEFAEKIAPKMQDYVKALKEAGNDPLILNKIKQSAYNQADEIFEKMYKAQRSGQSLPADFEKWAAMARNIGSTVKNHIEGLAGLVDENLAKEVTAANQGYGSLAGAGKALTSLLSKGDDPIKTSHFVSYIHHPKTSFAYDVARNVAKGGLIKARAQNGMANILNKTGIGESLSPIGKAVGELATRSTPMIESAQEMAGGKASEAKPAELSRNLYNQSDEQLKNVADTLGQSESFKHVGAALNNALANKDVQAKNSALFLLSSNPQARKILKERGLINSSD